MSEPPSKHDAPVGAATRRGIRWDALAAIIAALVGLLALLVAGYTAYIQRQQVRAQVWPYLQIGKSDADGRFRLVVINKGVGPAIVKSVEVIANGKPVTNWSMLFRVIGFRPTGSSVFSTVDESVLTPGEYVHWVVFDNANDIKTLVADMGRSRVELRVCYPSTLGESWLTEYRPEQRGGFRPRPVSNCPHLTAAQLFLG